MIYNQEYYATQRVRLDDKIYQEYKTTDSTSVGIVYFDETDNIVDNETRKKLLDIYMCKPYWAMFLDEKTN